MMNRSMMPKQIQSYRDGGVASLDGNVRTFNNDGIATLLPRETKIMDQDHMLAYITPDEAQTLMDLGGAGIPGPGGIPSYPPDKAVASDYKSMGVSSFDAGAATADDDSPRKKKKLTFISGDDKAVTGGFSGDTSGGSVISATLSALKNVGTDLKMGLTTIFKNPEDQKKALLDAGYTPAQVASYQARTANNIKESAIAGSGGGGGGSASQPLTQALTSGKLTPTQALEYLKATGDKEGTQAMLRQIVGLPAVAPANLKSFTDRFTKAYQAVPESQYGTYDFRKKIGAVDSDFRPTVRELMSILNVDAQTAQNYLNPEGLQYDFRNWSEILQSDDPLKATKDATYAMYLTPELFGRTPAAFTPEGFDLANAQSTYLYGTDPNFFGTNFMLPTEQELQEIKDLQGQVKTLQGEVDSFGTITPISSGVYQYPTTTTPGPVAPTPPGPVYPEPPVPVTPLPEVILEDTIDVPAPITSTGTGFVMPDFNNQLQTTLPGLGPEEGILTLPSQGPA